MVKEITITFDDGSLGRFSAEYADLNRVAEQIKDTPGYQYRAMDGTWGPVTPHPTIDAGTTIDTADSVFVQKDVEKSVMADDDDDFDTPYKTKFLHDDRERLLEKNAKLRKVIDFLLK